MKNTLTNEIQYAVASNIEEARLLVAGKYTDPKEWMVLKTHTVSDFAKHEAIYQTIYGTKGKN